MEVTAGAFPDVKRHFFSISCRHCAMAPCIEVCPAKAIVKRPDGIVIVNQDECIGCKVCLDACPFGVPQFGKDGLMQKCDMCLDRLEQGQKPICAETCPTEALHWGTVAELSDLAPLKAAKKIASTL
jgi:Fe-S-cluster-containing dehydrogenase component